MTTTISTVEEHQIVTWPVESFSSDNLPACTGPVELFLDRSNGDFGLVRYTSAAVAAAVRKPSTGEPIYFRAKDARAAAWREKCKKVSVLLHSLQIDLEFASAGHARGFLSVLEDLVTTNGNYFFHSYEVPA